MSKGQFFILDAVIGITILVTGIFIVYFAFIQEPVYQPTVAYAEDIISIFAKTRFKDMNLSLTRPEIKELVRIGRIDIDKTILAQLGELYYLKSLNQDTAVQAGLKKDMNDIILAVTGNIIPKTYGWKVKINGEAIHAANQGPSEDKAKINVVTQRLSFGRYKQWQSYGPYLVEVEVWR